VNELIDGIEVAKKTTEILLSEVSDIDLVLLYGAFAQGRGHSRSDYDMIAIINNKNVSNGKCLETKINI